MANRLDEIEKLIPEQGIGPTACVVGVESVMYLLRIARAAEKMRGGMGPWAEVTGGGRARYLAAPTDVDAFDAAIKGEKK